MKKLSLYVALVLVGLILFRATDAFAQKKMEKGSTLISSDDLKWVPMAGGPPGVMIAPLKGDMTMGAHEGLIKFPAGFVAPLHHHTYASKIIVIKGGYTYKGKVYGPGSYLFIPGGDKHVSGGVADSESIFYMEQSGKFDLIPEEAAKEKK